MQPAFRSTKAAWSFCILIALLLALPMLLALVGYPSREQAYASLYGDAGPVGMHVAEIYHDPGDVDVLLLGSSLVRQGVDREAIERELSARLGRPARVRMMALNWQGLDQMYFLLSDYLKTHRVRLILWNPPVPGSRVLEPHVQAFRWIRFGESSDIVAGLPLRYRLALYGDMVLGAPRELLAEIRPNRIGSEEMKLTQPPTHTGYYGADFVSETPDPAPVPPLSETCQQQPYPLIEKTGMPFTPYETYFARRILALARTNNARIALMHLPIDSEKGKSLMPERSLFNAPEFAGIPFIGVSSKTLFTGIDDARFTHFYLDQHFNSNGRTLFTRAVLPAIVQVYEKGACQ